KSVPRFVVMAQDKFRVRFDDKRAPLDRQNIAGRPLQSKRDTELINLAYELAGITDPADIGGLRTVQDLLQRLRQPPEAARAATKAAAVELLLRAFRAMSDAHKQSFQVAIEDDEYRIPANASAERGFKVVIYGHTHLAKRLPLDAGGL